MEADYYYILAWEYSVIDIREQFPLLPRSDTEETAYSFGYRHPKYPRTQTNEVMTTDFLITVQNEAGIHLEARYVKYKDDLNDERTYEKLRIEEQYWKARGIPFKIVTEQSINRQKAKNIQQLLGYYVTPEIEGFEQTEVTELKPVLMHQIENDKYIQLQECMRGLDIRFGMTAGTALSLFFHFAARKHIPLCIEKKLLPTQPINELINWERFYILAEDGGNWIADNA